ncbi:MAG: HIT domain-containing protein [Candidatus Saccharibacteria bacterium]|nr:HIT domain-containing protein [Candidatus Saccharibacteria bacterium]
MNANNNCPFCLKNNGLKEPIIFEDDLWYFASMNEESVSNAGMAITKRHVKTPFEINKKEWLRLHELLPKFKGLLDIDKPQGYNIGWNVHETGGQHVSHAHMHIVARYNDEPLAGKGIRYAFKDKTNARKSI